MADWVIVLKFAQWGQTEFLYVYIIHYRSRDTFNIIEVVVQLFLLGISHQIAKVKKKTALNFWKLLLAPLYTTNVVVWRGGGRRIRQINASLGGTLGCCPSSFKQAKLNEHFLDFPTTRGLNSDYSLPRRAWESNKTEAGVKLSECVNRDYSVPGQNTSWLSWSIFGLSSFSKQF